MFRYYLPLRLRSQLDCGLYRPGRKLRDLFMFFLPWYGLFDCNWFRWEMDGLWRFLLNLFFFLYPITPNDTDYG